MTLPSASELAGIRADFENYLLPDTCNILTETRTSDGAGGYTSTWGTATANVACRMDTNTRRDQFEMVAGGAQRPFIEYVVSFAHDTTINTGQRIEFDSVEFNVVSINEAQSWKPLKRAIVERVG